MADHKAGERKIHIAGEPDYGQRGGERADTDRPERAKPENGIGKAAKKQRVSGAGAGKL